MLFVTLISLLYILVYVLNYIPLFNYCNSFLLIFILFINKIRLTNIHGGLYNIFCKDSTERTKKMPESNNIEKGYSLLSESRFDEARELFTEAINSDPSLSEAYFGRLLAELELTSEAVLKTTSADIAEHDDFQKALAFAETERKQELTEIANYIEEKKKILSVYDSDFLENIYRRATVCEETSESYSKNAGVLRSIGGYRDSSVLAEKYEQIAAELKVKEDEAEKLRIERENKEKEQKRKKSDSIQIKIYSVAIVILSIFLIFLICYNVFLKDLIKKQEVLDEIYPLTYDDITVMTEDDAPWFSISDEGSLSFDDEKYDGDGKIVIPDVFENTLVTSLTDGAFNRASKIKSVVISDYVTDLGENTFEYCTSLESVTLPSSLSEISSYAFYNCSSLKDVVIPDTVARICKGAFSGCSSLEDIVLPKSLIYIENFSFQNCTSVKSLSLPKSVTYIGIRAFSGCDKFTDIYYSGSESEFESISIGVDNGALENTESESTTIIYNYTEK